MDAIRLISEPNGYSTKVFATLFDDDKPFFIDDFNLNSAKLREDFLNRLAYAYEAKTEQPVDDDDFGRLAFDLEKLSLNGKSSDQTETSKEGPTFEGIDAADLKNIVNQPIDWLVQGVIAADQATVLGARAKCGKTTLLCDLAVALASKTPWLAEFLIPTLKRVLLITGESSSRAAGKRILRACQSRGITLNDIRGMLRIEAVDFPKLPSLTDCDRVARAIEKHNTDVVIIDPLYRGLVGLDSSQLTAIGGSIVEFAARCRPASIILSHHLTKTASRDYGKPPELEDLTGAGVHESCGNWWLMGRNVPYEWDHIHDLCVQFGGRDEQAGGKRILFDEKAWTFEITPLHEYRKSSAKMREQAKQDAVDDEIRIARATITNRLENEKVARSKTHMRDTFGLKRKIFETAFADMHADGTIVNAKYRDGCNRRQTGYLLKKNAPKEMPDDTGDTGNLNHPKPVV